VKVTEPFTILVLILVFLFAFILGASFAGISNFITDLATWTGSIVTSMALILAFRQNYDTKKRQAIAEQKQADFEHTMSLKEAISNVNEEVNRYNVFVLNIDHIKHGFVNELTHTSRYFEINPDLNSILKKVYRSLTEDYSHDNFNLEQVRLKTDRLIWQSITKLRLAELQDSVKKLVLLDQEILPELPVLSPIQIIEFQAIIVKYPRLDMSEQALALTTLGCSDKPESLITLQRMQDKLKLTRGLPSVTPETMYEVQSHIYAVLKDFILYQLQLCYAVYMRADFLYVLQTKLRVHIARRSKALVTEYMAIKRNQAVLVDHKLVGFHDFDLYNYTHIVSKETYCNLMKNKYFVRYPHGKSSDSQA
jgi:hypothetical protein